MNKSISLLLILLTLQPVLLADSSPKSWTQRAKEIVSKNKIITGLVIGAVVLIGATSSILYMRSQDQKKQLAHWELNNRGYVRSTKQMSDREYQKFVQALTPDLEKLHVKTGPMQSFKYNINPPIGDNVLLTGYILDGVVVAQPEPNDDPQQYYKTKLEVITKLIDADAYPNGKTMSGGGSILNDAIRANNPDDIVKYLIEHRALVFENMRSVGPGVDNAISTSIEHHRWNLIPYILSKGLIVTNWQNAFEQGFRPYGTERFTPDQQAVMVSELRQIPQIPQDQLDKFLSKK